MKENKKVEESNLTVYEVGYHIVPTVAEENVPKEVDNLKSVITKGGSVISEGEPKLISLAYTIIKRLGDINKRFDKAYFGWIKFESSAEDALEIKKSLDNNPNILRFLLVKTLRDNTMFTPRREDFRKKVVAPVKEEGVTTATIEEIDKTIDELVLE